ncbi:MAG: hypothetical protein IKT26_06640 [Bacteroidaceae bacterium]|nr:hypothetical protein [Bacteroidaceae bacterium]
MSDGNFNRNLLPYRNYQSGLRAGRATLRTQALQALEELLPTHIPDATEEQRAALMAALRKQLK